MRNNASSITGVGWLADRMRNGAGSATAPAKERERHVILVWAPAGGTSAAAAAGEAADRRRSAPRALITMPPCTRCLADESRTMTGRPRKARDKKADPGRWRFAARTGPPARPRKISMTWKITAAQAKDPAEI